MSGSRPTTAFLALAFAALHAAAAPVATLPPLSTSADRDRTFVDITLPPAPADPAALVVEFATPVPSEAVRSVTLHLRIGDGWRSASIPADRARGTIRLPFGAFSSPEGTPGPIEKADHLRISLWRRASDSDTPSIPIAAVRLDPAADIAVVRPTVATAPKAADYAAQLSVRLERILSRAGVDFDTFPDTVLAKKIGRSGGSGTASPSVVILPYSPTLTSAHIAALKAHVAAGGRIIAFYNPSPDLSSLLGLAPPRYETAHPGWTAMAWGERRIPHDTEHILIPVVKGKSSATIPATWIDANGKDTRLPAIAVTRHGALFAHVPPLAFPAAQELLLSILDRPVPAEEAPQPPIDWSPFQIVGAWVPASRLPANVPSQLNSLYAYLAAIPTAQESEDGSATRPSQALHVWLPFLNPVDRPGHRWLDPTVPADRAAALRRVRAAAHRHPAGIHFDYLRSPGGTPASSHTADAITSLLREAIDVIRDVAPSTIISAAVFPTPADAAEHNQPWPEWLRAGLLDYAVPMLYSDDPAAFRASLAQCLAAAPHDRLVAGIGTGADEAQVDAAAFRAEVEAAAAAHLRGVVFFPLDDALRELLPAP